VGKSALFNWLAGRRISIVDPTAGVTRDRVTALAEADGRYFELVDTGGIGSEDTDNLTQEVEQQIELAIEQADIVLYGVDVRFEHDSKTFVAIDTAGVRKKKSISSDLEFYSVARAERSIRRADVVLLFLDPRLRISKVDKTLTEYILDQHKPAVFVVNKWDLVKESMPTERFATYVQATFPMLDFVPVAFITAKMGKNVFKLLNLAQNLHKQAGVRVGTGDLNRVVREALDAQPPPLRQNRRAKVYYATQVATH